MSPHRSRPRRPTRAASRRAAGQVESARRLLDFEGGGGRSANACAVAAGRVYDKLNAQLGPLLGTAGTQALFARSAKLAGIASPRRDVTAVVESAARLVSFLKTAGPETRRTAEALFGTFLSLVATFIGERLTLQALRRAWPGIEQPAPTENDP